MENLQFKECASCAAKPGSPALCPSCLHNRELIGYLAWYEEKHKQRRDQVYECMQEVAELKIKIADLTAELNLLKTPR